MLLQKNVNECSSTVESCTCIVSGGSSDIIGANKQVSWTQDAIPYDELGLN